MPKERNWRNIGISLAMSSAAITSCGPEQTPATPDSGKSYDVTVVEPGYCKEVVEDNIGVCNTWVFNYNNRVGIIVRRENGEWKEKDGIDLFRDEEIVLDGPFAGISMFRDKYNNIHVKLEEPLISATPFPTPQPFNPLPFGEGNA